MTNTSAISIRLRKVATVKMSRNCIEKRLITPKYPTPKMPLEYHSYPAARRVRSPYVSKGSAYHPPCVESSETRPSPSIPSPSGKAALFRRSHPKYHGGSAAKEDRIRSRRSRASPLGDTLS